MPGLKPDNAANVNKAFDIVTRLIKDSGIEDVSGVGLSSVEIEKGVYPQQGAVASLSRQRHRLPLAARRQGTASAHRPRLPARRHRAGRFLGRGPAGALDRCAKGSRPSPTCPRRRQWLEKLPAEFEQKTKVKWDAFLNSLGGEFGLVITLDPSNNIPVPLPGGALQIPTPGLLLAVKVNDDTIFNRIDEQLKANPQVISVDKPGLKMRTMPVPVPFIGELRPSTASSGGYLFIATSDALINEALAVKSGQKPGLKATDEFKQLAQGLPDQGNQFCYMSQRFAETLIRGAATGHGRHRQDRTADGAMDAILLPQPARLCLLRRHQHAGRLPDHRQRQPELRQCRAAARRGRGRHAGRHCHSQLRQSPDRLAAKCLHQQPPPD